MKLSDRLMRIANFVTEGSILADIGTDHGYIPIYLVENKIIPYAYAMDVREGPLKRAEEHIEEHSLKGKICLRLSDGLDKLNKNEADTILIAGMGGALTVEILKKGEEVLKTASELIVSPHSELNLVREYLSRNSFTIIKEEMLKDAGKYYVIMKWVNNNNKNGSKSADTLNVSDSGKCVNFDTGEYSEAELLYGRLLLKEKSNILFEYLNNEKNNYSKILASLPIEGKRETLERKVDITKRLAVIEEALEFYN